MVQSLKSKRRGGAGEAPDYKQLFTEGGNGCWAIAEEMGDGYCIITERSMTFIPEAILIALEDEYGDTLGWMVDMEYWRGQ